MDVYDNLDALGVNYEKLKKENQLLMNHTEQLENDIVKLCTEIKSMKLKQDHLTRNISELYNTAKCELERKDRTIAELRKQLDEVNAKKNFKPAREIPIRGEDKHYNRHYEKRSRSPKPYHHRPQQHQYKRTSRSPAHKKKRSNSPRDHHRRHNSSKDGYWRSKSHRRSPPRVHSRSPQSKRKQLYNKDAELPNQEIKEEQCRKINAEVKSNGQLDTYSTPIIPKVVEPVVDKECTDVNLKKTEVEENVVKKQCDVNSVLMENAVVQNASVSNKPVALRNRRKHCVMRLT